MIKLVGKSKINWSSEKIRFKMSIVGTSKVNREVPPCDMVKLVGKSVLYCCIKMNRCQLHNLLPKCQEM
jgi:hypothetical protein